MTLLVQILGISTALYLVALPWVLVRRYPEAQVQKQALARHFRLIMPLVVLIAGLTGIAKLG